MTRSPHRLAMTAMCAGCVKTSVELEFGRIESWFLMKRFVEGEDRRQGVLLPEYLDDFVAEENQVRVIEAFVDELDFAGPGV